MAGEASPGLVLVSRSLPPDVGGYQRQFQLLAPHLAQLLGPVLWIGAVRDEPSGRRPPAAGFRRLAVSAHRLPRRLRGLADLLVVALATCVLVVHRFRRRPAGALLLLSPTMVGGASLVRVAGRLGWRTSARFPSQGDQSHRRGRTVGRATNGANVVPSPGQAAEQEDFSVTVVPNAVRPTGQLRPAAPRAGTFLFLGRLVRDKRPHLVLRSWTSIAGELPGWRLVFAGGGGEQYHSVEPAMRTWVQEHAVERCELVGFVEDPSAMLCEADVLVFPSLREGLPNVVLEAMAAAVPVLADPKLTASWFGRSVPLLAWDGEESTLPGAMHTAAQSSQERRDAGSAGLRYVKNHHDPQRVAHLLAGLLRPTDAGALVSRRTGHGEPA